MSKPASPIVPAAIRWSAAAAAGLSMMGCPDPKEGASEASKDSSAAAPDVGHPSAEPSSDKECCFGKNDCKGKGGCAVPENNACAGKNECKGKGGCNMHCPK